MRRGRWLWLARVLTASAVTVLAIAGTCRLTLLRPTFAAATVNEVQGFDRLYSEILPASDAQAALRTHLAAVPLDADYLTANLRLLLPPEVLAQVLTRLQHQYVAVVTGRERGIDPVASLQPVVDHASRVLTELAPGLLAQAPRASLATVNGFAGAFERYRHDLAQGRLPVALPNVTLTTAQATALARTLSTGLDAAERATLRPELEALLRLGDLSSALATVLPLYLDDVLPATMSTNMATAARSFSDSASQPLKAELGGLPIPLDITLLLPSAAMLLVVGLYLLARSTARPGRELRATLLGSLVVALLAGLILLAVLPDPVRDAAQAAPSASAQRALLVDLDERLRGRVSETYVLILTLSGLSILVPSAIFRARRDVRSGPRSMLAAATATAVLASTAVIVATRTGETSGTCNGQALLCQRRFDQATYLTSHNAMASSTRSFLNANQDPDLTGQLDNGVRGLMLDLHPWTAPPQLASYVDALDPDTRRALSPLLKPLVPRPGVWLCHIVCQLGADSAVTQLRSVGTWMRAHRDAVVTLILEDHVSEQQVRDTIIEAGLLSLVATPPRGTQPWPTLGAMVRSNHRLVVFTERAAPTAGWLRNLYAYAAETPYEAASPADLSCRPGRGPSSAPLFLLNNWISTPAPARSEAARVNSASFLRQRTKACQQERAMKPTFLAVNFAQSGQPLAVVDALNAVASPSAR